MNDDHILLFPQSRIRIFSLMYLETSGIFTYFWQLSFDKNEKDNWYSADNYPVFVQQTQTGWIDSESTVPARKDLLHINHQRF